jgi:hypothetical protein
MSVVGPQRQFGLIPGMVAIGGIADIVQHWHEMARSRMTRSGHRDLSASFARQWGNKPIILVFWILVPSPVEAPMARRTFGPVALALVLCTIFDDKS